MVQVNMHDAKTNLSALVKKAAAGEPFVIAIAGRPMVRVLPLGEPDEKSGRIGFMKGQGSVPADFDTLGSSEIAKMFGVAQ